MGRFMVEINSTARTKPTGLLHLGNDWFLLSDLDNKYQFPGHIAVTALRPDVVIYSNLLKRVIIIELTCPCEENMATWHLIKLNKYSCLVNIIKANGWVVDIFAIEVGARGYCSRSVTTCLKKLGFSNKLAFSTAKQIGQTSMKCSFCIWVARDSQEWSQSALISSIEQKSPTPNNSEPVSPPVVAEVSFNTLSNPLVSQKPTPSQHNILPPKHAGLLNKGNTCYANSILQALSVLPSLWSQSSSEGLCQSPLVKAITLNMSLLNRSSSRIDPSNFLIALQNIMSARDKSFNFNTQQDVPEILPAILDELKGYSTLSEETCSVTIRSSISCDVCFCESIKEDKFDILDVPVLLLKSRGMCLVYLRF